MLLLLLCTHATATVCLPDGCTLNITGHSGDVTSLSSTGKEDGLLATSSSDGTACVWNISGGMLSRYTGHTGPVAAVAISAASGGVVATAGEDHTVRIWDASTATTRVSIGPLPPPDLPTSIALSPDADCVAVGTAASAAIWDTSTGRQAARLGGNGRVNGVAFSPDGRLVATAGGDNALRLWGAGGWAQLWSVEAHSAAVLAVAFSPDGRLLASGGDDEYVRVWDVSGRAVSRLRWGRGGVAAVAFSNDSRVVAAESHGEVRMWDVQHRASIMHSTPGRARTIHAGVAFAGGRLATAAGSHVAVYAAWQESRYPKVLSLLTGLVSFGLVAALSVVLYGARILRPLTLAGTDGQRSWQHCHREVADTPTPRACSAAGASQSGAEEEEEECV